MFNIVKGPKVSREAVEKKAYGEEFMKIFDDCDGCIDLAMDYAMSKDIDIDMTARDFTEMKNRFYLEHSCLVDEITLEEYTKAQVKVPNK